MKKKFLEVGEGDIYILIRPKADNKSDWLHETTITCNKSAKIPDDAFEHYFQLARAMVGFSYITNDELTSLYNTFFEKAVKGKITGKEGEMLWELLDVDFELDEPVVERKDNVIHVDFTKGDQ